MREEKSSHLEADAYTHHEVRAPLMTVVVRWKGVEGLGDIQA